jgi:hypothetical protein
MQSNNKLLEGDCINQKSKTVSSPMPASPNKRLKARVTLFGFNSNTKQQQIA